MNKPVGFEKQLVEVHDLRIVIEGYRNIPQTNENFIWKMPTCNRWDLETLGSWQLCPNISPDTCCDNGVFDQTCLCQLGWVPSGVLVFCPQAHYFTTKACSNWYCCYAGTFKWTTLDPCIVLSEVIQNYTRTLNIVKKKIIDI